MSQRVGRCTTTSRRCRAETFNKRLPPPCDRKTNRRRLWPREQPTMTDLRTKYLGLNLKNPLVLSASPLSRSMEDLRKAEDSKAAAVVLYSLFEEQIEIE